MHHAAHAFVAARPSGRSRPATASRPSQALAWLGALGLMLVLHSSPLLAKDAPTAAAPAPKTSATAAAPAPAGAPTAAPASRPSPSAAPTASAPATPTPPAADKKQTTRMSECSAQFKTTGKPGSERKAFMQVCLRKPKA